MTANKPISSRDPDRRTVGDMLFDALGWAIICVAVAVTWLFCGSRSQEASGAVFAAPTTPTSSTAQGSVIPDAA
jgi:hypothetical protein